CPVSSVDGAGALLEAFLDGGQVAGVAEDDEDGVVAGEGAEDLGPFLPVDGLGDGLSAADHGLDDEEVAGAFGAEEEGGQETCERRGGVPGLGRQGVVGAALGVVDLDEAELSDVARQGGLCDVEAARLEQLAQLLLTADAVSLNEL